MAVGCHGNSCTLMGGGGVPIMLWTGLNLPVMTKCRPLRLKDEATTKTPTLKF